MNLGVYRFFLGLDHKPVKSDPIAIELAQRDQWKSENEHAKKRVEFYRETINKSLIEKNAQKLDKDHDQFTATLSPWHVLNWRNHHSVPKNLALFFKNMSRDSVWKSKVDD